MIKPHELFMYWSADQVAECMDGVPDDLCRKLYQVVEFAANTPGLDYREVNDSFDHCLGHAGWRRLTDTERQLLNDLAIRYELAGEAL
jgi:hypothetical protein